MNDNHNPFTNPTAGAIVYVREADRETLPERLREIPGKIYAVHDQEGNCLAISPDRALAFVTARQHDLTPVSVH